MFSQFYIENNILFHAIVSQFLVNGTGGRGAGEKNGEVWDVGEWWLKNCHSASNLFFEWPLCQVNTDFQIYECFS